METISYQKEVKANKDHICDFCGLKINIGQPYMKSTHKHDGDVYDWKTHKHCADIAEKLKMYDDADDGVTMSIFMDTVSDEHDDLLVKQLPFDKDNPRKFSDIIRQLRFVDFKHKLDYVVHFHQKNHKTDGETD